MVYNHLEIESKWQKRWEEDNVHYTDVYSDKEKFYALDMFPYPSGSGLHVGHPKGYTATDIVARFKKMQGYEVLHPIGWDAFGLPAEQYALNTGNDPRTFTNQNINIFRKQIKSLGFSYDYSKEVNTTDPKYYKWTQWIFIKLFENGLAEIKEIPVNFCPTCKTVLANEEVIDGKCERGGHDIIKKPMKQWVLKITKYADRLLEDLEDLDWPESLKNQQRNWIGKSEGANVSFPIVGYDDTIDVFTTRPDTIFGVTYLVVSPENDLVKNIISNEQASEVNDFILKVKNLNELDRTELNKDKSGVFTGSYAKHPLTGEKLPIWIGDYVLNYYGTGMVMAVPAHDDRDYEFAKKYNLPIRQVIEGDISTKAYTEDGIHINSDFANGLTNKEASDAIINKLESIGYGLKKTSYKLRDWLFSRQRYWGEPFPIYFDNDDIPHAVDEKDLPIKLPILEKIEPSDTGESPLKNAKDWLKYKDGTLDTNTMPQWAGSCWYYIRYIDVNNDNELVSKDLEKAWLPVDLYVGGAEHAVLHLLYARFWHKFLYDIGVVSQKEPFQKIFNQGMILGDNNEKMSKSKGNVVNPDSIVKSHGADTLRIYEMFMGPLDASIAWSEKGVEGARRFLDKVYDMYSNLEIVDGDDGLEYVYNQTVKKVTNDFSNLSFNTALSQMMIFLNAYSKNGKINKEHSEGFIKLLSPLAPHISDEIWNDILGQSTYLYLESWPEYDESKLIEEDVEIVVQVNGKVRSKLVVNINDSDDLVLKKAKEKISEELVDKIIKKEIVIKNRLVNFVI